MRAIEFHQFGDLSQLRLTNRPDPQATATTAVVRIEAASVNPSDVKNVLGAMAHTTLPRIPGRDYSGVVIDGPAEWVGQPVWGTGGDVGFTRDGTHAESIEVPVASLVRKPDRLSHESAASSGVTFITAWIGVAEYGGLSPGETLVVIGAGGGVGGAAIQIGKYLGARAVAISRHPLPAGSAAEKVADLRIEPAKEDVSTGVRSFTAGRGADLVLDVAGGPMLETALKLLAPRGRLIEITAGKERRVSFDLIDFYRNESQLFGVNTLHRDLTQSARTLRELAPGFDSGAFFPPLVSRVLPLSAAPEAYQLVVQGQSGRVVLLPALQLK